MRFVRFSYVRTALYIFSQKENVAANDVTSAATWRARHDLNVRPSESETVSQGCSETLDGVYVFRKKSVI